MFKNFMKKYGYYLMAFALVLVVGVAAGIGGNPLPSAPLPDGESKPTGTASIKMVSPISSPEVVKWYSDTELFYNSTLKQWESHKGVDLTSKNGGDVVSVLDGIVTDSSYSYQNGYCVTVDHGNGLVTVYCSLKDNNNVKKGDSVSKGQKIGEISSSASNEASEGDHLHFQVQLNGKNVDPSNYLTFENK